MTEEELTVALAPILKSIQEVLKKVNALEDQMLSEWVTTGVARKELHFKSIQGVHALLERTSVLEPEIDWKQGENGRILIRRGALEKIKRMRVRNG